MMYLALKRAGRSLIEQAIAWKTNGPYCHCELIFDLPSTQPQLSFSSYTGQGVCFCQNAHGSDRWDFVPVGIARQDAVLATCHEYAAQHMKYDWPGIFGFVFPRGEHDDKDRFCSEVCCEVLAKNGYFPAAPDRWKVSPCELYQIARDAAAATVN